MLKRLTRTYLQWRHGRGYGVHSPFSYRLISEVLNCDLCYYDYARLSRRENADTAWRLAMLLRILCRFEPTSVWIARFALQDAVGDVVRRTLPEVRIVEPASEAEFLVAPSLSTEVYDELAKAASPSGEDRVLFVPGPMSSSEYRSALGLLEGLSCGMSYGENQAFPLLVVARKTLPRQHFDIRYKRSLRY